MGSFNATCFASRQPIVPNSECLVLPIRQSGSTRPAELEDEGQVVEVHSPAALTCYPHSYWSPAGGFIRAKYDGYGKFKLIDTPINRIRLLAFFKDLVTNAVVSRRLVESDEITLITIADDRDDRPTPASPKKSKEVVFDIKSFLGKKVPELAAVVGGPRPERAIGSFDPDMTFGAEVPFSQFKKAWDYVAKAISEHVVFMNHRFIESPRPVEFAVVHPESFKALIEVAEGPGIDGEPAHPRKESFKDFTGRNKVVRTAVAARTDSSDELHARAAVLLFEPYFFFLGSYVGLDYPAETAEISYAGVKRQESWPTKTAEWLEELKETIDSRFAIIGMNDLRIAITPMVFANQDYSDAFNTGFVKLVEDVCAEVSLAHRGIPDDEE